MSLIAIFLDGLPAEDLGGVPPDEIDGRLECPKCHRYLDSCLGDIGYGFAGGGGLGVYYICPDENGCGWSYKQLTPHEDD